MTIPTEERTGKIRMHSNTFYDFLKPTADMIKLDDIAHHLAWTFRFSGAAEPGISVAEHSVLVSRLVPAAYRKAAIMHDAPEAYLWDIPRPAKHLYGDVYEELTGLCEVAICDHFRLDRSEFHCETVNDADNIALNYEGNQVMPEWEAEEPTIPEGVLDWKLGLDSYSAKRLFRMECNRIGISMKPDVAPPLPVGLTESHYYD